MARSDLEWMKEAWRLTRKDGAPGIDGMTAVDYAKRTWRPTCWTSSAASSRAAIRRRRCDGHIFLRRMDRLDLSVFRRTTHNTPHTVCVGDDG